MTRIILAAAFVLLLSLSPRRQSTCFGFVVFGGGGRASRQASRSAVAALGIGGGHGPRPDGGRGDPPVGDGVRRRRRMPPPPRRRDVLDAAIRAAAFLVVPTTMTTTMTMTTTPSAAMALDFDAFESSVISKDEARSAPVLSDDEALCRYGAPGKAMGEACDRAKVKPNLPNFVDATGKVDRGDYLRCRYEYPTVNGEYVKTRVCKPSGEWGAP